MMFSKLSRRFLVALFFAVVLAACGGSEEAAAPETTEPVAEAEAETEAEEVEAVEPEESESESATEAPAGIDPDAEFDDRTDEERAIDSLDFMLVQLQVGDLIATADCVIERLEEEGIELVGQGSPELAAALACDRTAANQLFAASSFPVPEEDGECIVNALVDAIISVPLNEVDAFFTATTPPAGVLDMIVSECDVTLDQLNQGFG